MPTKQDRIAALEAKEAAIRARIQALKNHDAEQERKNETRRKILLGGYVLAQLKAQGLTVADLNLGAGRFLPTLNSDRDRALFGLAGAPALSQPSDGHQADAPGGVSVHQG